MIKGIVLSILGRPTVTFAAMCQECKTERTYGFATEEERDEWVDIHVDTTDHVVFVGVEVVSQPEGVSVVPAEQ
ncbi:hypothetical protein [Mycobacteroides abscessus]|uniref:hypothetical protein n=1 Tax=Mycobacteroides abscessus TaxID=36809 RepID=UPI0009290360|nr:hypothetical protein [Mycobacteroides abscessus]DAZ90316.1 TPA_asm: hypothetical protein PROPHIFSQJ01-1_30 [Mycobacterium phage prophiFSQJ01-1]SII40669.1 Uncharacterised protein [Mycobacteroides abscessus subsp. abscessus]SIK14556.1 Uncharacterised protein [Mycobacteroides abscessus subsp. abscessus]SIN25171.1 Uncharacterised protein [Mycobacteroides abscessus subsp. abscessus]SLI51796.1 Uncharacterised protein [Mycobacteroides abscessus subsp. abscessus]